MMLKFNRNTVCLSGTILLCYKTQYALTCWSVWNSNTNNNCLPQQQDLIPSNPKSLTHHPYNITTSQLSPYKCNEKVPRSHCRSSHYHCFISRNATSHRLTDNRRPNGRCGISWRWKCLALRFCSRGITWDCKVFQETSTGSSSFYDFDMMTYRHW